MLNSPVFNEMGFGIVQLSKDGDILDANSIALKFFETDFKALKKKSFFDFTDKKHVARNRRTFEAADDNQVYEIRFQTAIVLPNGRKKWCRINAKPEFKDGKLSYVLAAIHETESKTGVFWKKWFSFGTSLVLSILISGHTFLHKINELFS